MPEATFTITAAAAIDIKQIIAAGVSGWGFATADWNMEWVVAGCAMESSGSGYYTNGVLAKPNSSYLLVCGSGHSISAAHAARQHDSHAADSALLSFP